MEGSVYIISRMTRGDTPLRHAFCFMRLILERLRTVMSPERDLAAGGVPDHGKAGNALDNFGNSILRLAYSYMHNMDDAEDVLQDTLIQYIKSSPDFRSSAHEKAWLLKVAGNISKNKLEHERIRIADELNEELVSDDRSDLSFVWEAVKSLPVKYREVIHLYYCDGYRTAEIAEILGENESTVRSHLARGRVMLVIIGAAVIPNLQGSGQDTQNGNPVAECGSVSELAEKAGFPVSEVPGLPFNISGEKYSLTGGIAEIEYTGSNNETAVFRKSAGSEDNSGDSTDYDKTVTAFLNHGKTKTTLKGSGNTYKFASWTRGGYSYSVVMSQGISETKWNKIVAGVE